ncbi:patatin-like phospholipase family protein [Actinomadura viridis]|uniref:NTE family protein n=1 Tax=Actinomadura viridis TaxID=58110 RepID=A0A931DKZ9_9ACTN|nr:patatin-like phospholipase family protein [Actinomadura viridis]MBG6088980.1 NTE family protein [Actinomadura viridis]
MADGGRALVLGGGGITGIAWEWGILSGLAEAGIDLYGADLVIGTSAGSLVGAQVASGVDAETRYQVQLAGAGGEIPARVSRAVMARWAWAALRSRTPAQAGARIGRLALAARTAPEAERRAVIESRLPVRHWPDRPLKITAVDAVTGAFTVFDRATGVSLVDAVGASCAVPCVWPPVTIDGRRYIDGGVRSPANVDLAAGYGGVVVLAPSTGGFGPIAGVGRQVAALRRAGGRVAVISPDRRAREAFGGNSLDPGRRAPAARAGRAQSPSVAEAVAAVWEGA